MKTDCLTHSTDKAKITRSSNGRYGCTRTVQICKCGARRITDVHTDSVSGETDTEIISWFTSRN